MLRCYDKMGELTISQDQQGVERRFKINIYTCNALAAFVYDNYWTETETGKKHHDQTLYSFFADTQHAKNILKNEKTLFYDKVTSIKLNLFFKEAMPLMKILVKAGYKVTAYYKEVESKK